MSDVTSALDFSIVGLGASAGGLDAFEAFFAGLPRGPGLGMAFVLVQHLSPEHDSLLPSLLARGTTLPVVEATDGLRVQPDCIYVIPPRAELTLAGGALHLTEAPRPGSPRLPIDAFFRSLALELGEKAICVVLSGTGSDGAQGLRAVKEAGGLALAQAPETAGADGMPRAAIATGLVDCVLPPADLGPRLVAWARQALDAAPSPPPSADLSILRHLCAVVAERTGHDFSGYKPTTLSRRVGRRMAVHRLERLNDYLRYLEDTPLEAQALFLDLLIGVTAFFRDPLAFAALEQEVLPRLFEGRPAHDPVRVWVCGCSTGEEAYSVAMLAAEYQAQHPGSARVQIFATDVDPHAIAQARTGLFPSEGVEGLSPTRQAMHFEALPGGRQVRIKKSVRDLIVFSEQDVVRDPPFSRVDLICCRNLLIYLDTALQQQLMTLFQHALNPGGVLFLGSSETVGDSADGFAALNRQQKLYERRAPPGGERRRRPARGVPLTIEPRGLPLWRRDLMPPPQAWLTPLVEHLLREESGATGVVVDRRGEVVHVQGHTAPFLEQPEGAPSLNLLLLARDGLKAALSTALHDAATHRQQARASAGPLRVDGADTSVQLVVRPLSAPPGSPSSELFLVVFQTGAEPPASPPPTSTPGEASRLAALEQALREKEAHLQSTLARVDTSHADLESSNEEMQSVNEELQSTNEELETSKEELQAVNEELATVNAELQLRVAELSRANNDMNNLLAGTGVATLFVGPDLSIVRYTPSATEFFRLIPGDVGRPVTHVVSNLVGEVRLAEMLARVLTDLEPREVEVQTRIGGWYLLRVRPYRTLENVVQGAVITFTDISRVKEAELGVTARGMEAVGAAIFDPFVLLDAPLDAHGRVKGVRVLDANEPFCRLAGKPLGQLKGQSLADAWAAADRAWGDTLTLVAERGAARPFEFSVGPRGPWLRGRAFRPVEGSPQLGVVLTAQPPSSPSPIGEPA